VERALAYEALRQWELWLETGTRLGAPGGHKTTRGWDDQAQLTRPQRQKEESSDYRYFPDPDLVPVQVTPEEAAAIRAGLGELPAALRQRLEATCGLDPYDSDVIVNQGRRFVDYYLELAAAGGDGKRASNWVQQDVLRVLNERGVTIEAFPVPAAALAELLRALSSGDLDSSRAKDAFQQMLDRGVTAAQAMQALGIEKVDQSALVDLCRQLLSENPSIVADVKAGKEKAVGALIGQAKRRNPNAQPNQVRDLCLQLIRQM
jgi:aspartyl-tRNA(Asn)/glutamyl-tRNA(Gln) amidotransferase subunit B